MANPEHVRILKQGVEAWNEWRKAKPDVTPALQGANLSREDFSKWDFSWVYLSRADLSGANLCEAHLRGANLSEANLSGTLLCEADLTSACLQGANLSEAILNGSCLEGAYLNKAKLSMASLINADLSGAHLNGTDLSESVIGYTRFGGNDLSTAEGLDSIKHNAPSSIDIDTIYRSKGKIRESFLRGAGVPDNFIEYMHSLSEEAFENRVDILRSGVDDQELRTVLLLHSGTITMMFTDVKGSTNLKWLVGDDEVYFHKVQTPHNELLKVCINEHEGAVLNVIGDAFFAGFQSAKKAVRCAVKIQRQLVSNPISTPNGPLSVRIGLHTGEPLLHQNVMNRLDLSGNDVDEAARITSLANGGQVLISAQTSALLQNVSGLRIHSHGSYPLKGLSEAQEIVEVLWDKKQPQRPSGGDQADPFECYSCFISYSSKDQAIAERLYTELQNKGVRCWYFREDATWGKSVWGEIDQGIKQYDKLLVICSRNSLVSGPVLREIERALNREDEEGKDVLFPVTIDNYLFDDWEHSRKADVRSKVVGDFTRWKDHDSYQKAFDRLLRDLKAG